MVLIRVATEADAEKLLAIYGPYVTDTTISFEYAVPSLAEFRQRITETVQNYPYLVAENAAGELLGYAYAHAYKERSAYDWAVEVTIYLAPAAKGQGIGRKLYQALENELMRQNVWQLTACIAGDNEASKMFHVKQGYRTVGVFQQIGYKFDQWIDVVWLQKSLPKPEPLAKFIPYQNLAQLK